MKKALTTLMIILLTILFKLTIIFTINEIIIYNFKNEINNTSLVKVLHFLNINEPYIAYYNEGNIFYAKKDYDKAISNYEEALEKNPSQKRVCDIRINLSLAKVKNINTNNYQVSYNALEDAKNNLYNNECAHKNDDKGYSKDAENLEELIKELQKQLENNHEQPSDSDNRENSGGNNEIKDKLKDINKKSINSRKEDMNYYNQFDDSYYSGKRW